MDVFEVFHLRPSSISAISPSLTQRTANGSDTALARVRMNLGHPEILLPYHFLNISQTDPSFKLV